MDPTSPFIAKIYARLLIHSQQRQYCLHHSTNHKHMGCINSRLALCMSSPFLCQAPKPRAIPAAPNQLLGQLATHGQQLAASFFVQAYKTLAGAGPEVSSAPANPEDLVRLIIYRLSPAPILPSPELETSVGRNKEQRAAYKVIGIPGYLIRTSSPSSSKAHLWLSRLRSA